MKIVTWNCNGALRNKLDLIEELNADIYVIQECENPKLTKNTAYQEWSQNHIWQGDSKNKGIGIFAHPNLKLEQLHWSNIYLDHTVKHFLPCRINNSFNLLAVWTHRNNSPNFGYIGQLWKYLHVNKTHFKDIIIAGDLNSNSKWDQWDRWWNHSDVVNELSKLGIESLYHKYSDELQGQEKIPTFFHHRKLDKPYHIDYIFGSENFSKALKHLHIGNIDSWLSISDHLPLIAEFDL